MKKKRRRGRRPKRFDRARTGIVCGEPTAALPGSPEKIKIRQERFARHECLHVPGDTVEKDKIAINIGRAPGNFRKWRDREQPILDQRSEEEKQRGEKITKKVTTHDVAHKMRIARQNKGLSGRQAARLLSIDHSCLVKIEQRKKEPSLFLVYRCALAFDVSADWLTQPAAGQV